MTATPAKEVVPVLSWDDFLARFRWEQGEHMFIVGPTGGGKTTLALALLDLRKYVIAFGTKPEDKTLDGLIRRGWKRIRDVQRLPEVITTPTKRIVFWPKVEDDSDLGRLAYQTGATMRYAFKMRRWCLYFDEIWMTEQMMALHKLMRWFLTQSRSIGITMVGGTQRPAHIDLLWYSQCTHLFFARVEDEADLKRIAGINGLNGRMIRDIVASLNEFEFLYVNSRKRVMIRTTAPAK